jgi:hypothetical protein
MAIVAHRAHTPNCGRAYDRLLTDLHCDRLRSLVADELKTLGVAT